MADLTEGFLKSLAMMSGEIPDKKNSITGLDVDASDMEILDYIMVQLCSCLDTKKIAFKGRYVLNKIIMDEVPRATVDVDFSIQTREYYNAVKEVLRSIGENLVNDGLFNEFSVKEDATETCSGGLDLKRGTGSQKKLGVDVGVHDITHGIVPVNILGVDVSRFSVERMLSDKLSAIYSRKRFRRPKDLYDFYIITNCFDVDLDMLNNELSRREVDWNASPMKQEVTVQYKRAYNSLKIAGLSDNNIKSIEDTAYNFDTVIGRVGLFVDNIRTKSKWVCSKRMFI